MNIDSVKYGTGYFFLVLNYRTRRTNTVLNRIAEVAAGARVHGCRQYKVGGESFNTLDASHRNSSFLKRLAQGFNYPAVKFGDLIKKKNSVMSQSCFSRPGIGSSADDRCIRSSMVRGSKRSLGEKRLAFV